MAYDIKEFTGRGSTYVAKRTALAERYVEQIKAKGLHAEINFEGEVSVSFTGFGLDQVYATIGLDELEYHLDNDDEFNFALKPVDKVADADEAQQIAIDWQNWQSEQSLSTGELAEFSDYFGKLAKRFNLTDEFNENGII